MYSFYKYLHLVKCKKRDDFMTENFSQKVTSDLRRNTIENIN